MYLFRRFLLLIINICRSKIAAQFSRVLRKPNNEYLITGNYLIDYQDSLRRFGAILQGVIIANPSTNIPEVIYVTLNNYASGTQINQLSVSIYTFFKIKKVYFICVMRISMNLIIICFFYKVVHQSGWLFPFISDNFLRQSDKHKRYSHTVQIG